MAEAARQYIIPFYGERRGAARAECGRAGTSVTLSLRPEAGKAAAEPTAVLIASAEGKTLRIPLEKGRGTGETAMDIAVLLLCAADGKGGERIVAEGVRSGFDRRAVEGLKEKLRALRCGGRKKEASPPCPSPACEAEREEPADARRECDGKETADPGAVPETPAPQSEALRDILKRAEELFPEKMAAAGHFASDRPFDAPFIPRPLAPKAQQRRSVPAVRVRDEAWHAAVREMRRGGKLSGVGRAEGAAEPLFPVDFPGVPFRCVCWPDSRRYYLEGQGTWEGKRAVFYAVPGEPCSAAHFKSRGFSRFLRDKNGSGYWVKIRIQD